MVRAFVAYQSPASALLRSRPVVIFSTYWIHHHWEPLERQCHSQFAFCSDLELRLRVPLSPVRDRIGRPSRPFALRLCSRGLRSGKAVAFVAQGVTGRKRRDAGSGRAERYGMTNCEAIRVTELEWRLENWTSNFTWSPSLVSLSRLAEAEAEGQ